MDGSTNETTDYWSGLWSGHRVTSTGPSENEVKEPFSWSLSLFANEEYPSALGASVGTTGPDSVARVGDTDGVGILQGRWNPATKQVQGIFVLHCKNPMLVF